MKGLIFTYALTYGGAVLALFNPFYGFLIYVAFAILKPEALWHWSVPAGNYSRIIAIALLAGWVINRFGDWNFGKASKSIWCLMAFWAWIAISAVMAKHTGRAFVHVEALSKIYLPVLVGMTLLDSLDRVKLLAWVIVSCQGYLALELNVAYLRGQFISHTFDFASLDNNSVGITMCSAIGLAFFLGLYAPRWWQKGIALAAAALMSHFVFFSFSRGAMLALAITCLVTFLLVRKTLRHYLAVVVAVALLLRMAGPQVREEFVTVFDGSTEVDQSSRSRVENWQLCLFIMGEQPLFGIGPQNYPERIEEFAAKARIETHGHLRYGRAAHSLWMQVGAETGIVGLALLASYYGLCALGLWPISRRPLDPDNLWPTTLASAVLASLAGFVVSAQFVSIEGVELPYYVCLVGAGVLRWVSTEGADAYTPEFHSQGIIQLHQPALTIH